MTRFALTLLTLLALAAPAKAAESFLGVATEGPALRFTSQAPSTLGEPSAITGLDRGDRVVAMTPGLALGRSGRLYRLRADLLRATPTPALVALQGATFSVVATEEAATQARVLSDAGQDVLVDLASGAVTPGPGLRSAAGEVLRPAVGRLRDGRLAGVVSGRPLLYTETAPGSNVLQERPLRLRDRVAFPHKLSVAVAGDAVYVVTGFAERLRRPQSQFLRIDLSTFEVRGEAGPYFPREIQAVLATGTIPDDNTAPRLRVLSAPRTLSLRRLRTGDYRVRLRCDEPCSVFVSTAVGGRSNAGSGATRATTPAFTVRLAPHSLRELRLLRLGRARARLRFFAADFAGNTRTIYRRVRIVP
jgi:mRNA-degrading endonuclease RelE of RelBE toxin-antitoxin system